MLPEQCGNYVALLPLPGSTLATRPERAYDPRMRRFLPTALIIVAEIPSTDAEYPASVIGVIDGDTLTVLRDGKTQVRIRLAGIDPPESDQDFGTRAKQAASDLAFGKTVKIIERDTEHYTPKGSCRSAHKSLGASR